MDMDIGTNTNMDKGMNTDMAMAMDLDKDMDMNMDMGMEREWTWKQIQSMEFLNMSSSRHKDLGVVCRIPVKMLTLIYPTYCGTAQSSALYRMV